MSPFWASRRANAGRASLAHAIMCRALWLNASIRQNERWKRRRPPKLSSSSAPVQLLTVSSPRWK